MRRPMLSPLVRAVLVAAPLILLAAGPAWAQLDSREGIALRNDIYQLQQEVQALQQQVARSGAASPTYLGGGGYSAQSGSNDIVTQLLARVDDLSEQVRQLRGRIEEAENKIQQQGADLGKRIDDLAFQVQNGGVAPPSGTQAATPGFGQPPPPSAAPAISPPPAPLGATVVPPPPPRSATIPRTPEAAMREGTTALARRDYPAAEAAAREVLSRFRTSPRAYDAQYLLAQALAGERQFPQAAIAYDDAYNRSRKGAHAQEALLGLASALTAINEKKAACDTLVKLRVDFPQQHPNVREAAAELHRRAACR